MEGEKRMDKKILVSMMVIGLVATLAGAGLYAYFNDVEKSEGNVFTAGTIDISVDGENPWVKTYSTFLSDVKPSEIREFTFVITNVGTNPAKVWKRIVVTGCSGGTPAYPAEAPVASSEPEWEECGGGTVAGYVERCWLPPYILYDLYVGEIPIVNPNQHIRVDNIDGFWIYLGEIDAGHEMTVKQSYHLASWEDAPVPAVTNWAQGDKMTFDIELYAEQVDGKGPVVADTLTLKQKDPVTWEEVAGGYSGILTLSTGKFVGTVKASTAYSLIYYKDPWATGSTGSVLLGTGTSNVAGAITIDATLGTIPTSDDLNFPIGGKIWLVPSDKFSGTTVGGKGTLTWAPSEFLFEMHLITHP
jgi:predicted ribosomally synthesized peptide with SipW-like signal peptide